MTKIKICGLTRKCDIDYVNEIKPDYIGFVFYNKSKRFIEPDTALVLKKLLAPSIKAVGVFVNDSIDEILSNKAIDIIQLHGDEDEDFIKKLKSLTNKPVIKAFHTTDIKKSSAEFILFDTPSLDYGGSGRTFDWAKLPKLNFPFFLAGGININNVDEAMKFSPYCIDVSSGVETDGYKDKEKIKKIVDKVKL